MEILDLLKQFHGSEKFLKDTPNIVEMARHFESPSEMSKALGYTSAAAAKWFRLQNKPCRRSDEMARAWLADWDEMSKATLELFPDKYRPILEPKPEKPNDQTFIVICPDGKSEKVARVLTMMGCEVEAI